jgi:hypothetical protein
VIWNAGGVLSEGPAGICGQQTLMCQFGRLLQIMPARPDKVASFGNGFHAPSPKRVGVKFLWHRNLYSQKLT